MCWLNEQIEQYMSLEYMANMPAFVVQLDKDGYMPLDYLLSQTSLRELDVDQEMIISVIQSMDTLNLSPDHLGVRISLPIARNTIIIRDLPKDFTESSLRELLSSFPVDAIKEEVANSWFVTLGSDEAAIQACDYLQSLDHFPQPVKARVKSEFYMKVLMKKLQGVKSSVEPSPSELDVPYQMQFQAPISSSSSSSSISASTTTTTTSTPPRRRRLSIAAKPFSPANLSSSAPIPTPMSNSTSFPVESNPMMTSMSEMPAMTAMPEMPLLSRLSLHEEVDDLMQKLGACWDDPLMKSNPIDYDFNSSNYPSEQRYSESSYYYDHYEVMSDDRQSYASMQSSLPFVTTQSEEIGGYKEPFIQYSPSDILCIVQGMIDISMPPIATPGDHSIALVQVANTELVQKGRTMSIDMAVSSGLPRTYSVDSVDYTCMLTGEVEEEVVEVVRKQRKHRKRRGNGNGNGNSNRRQGEIRMNRDKK